ncbi:MAG: hypothetical protein D3921_06080 [Candidatus Electrothrix sp. AW1]|nr:hypothetical protein [Candidatus Electrothrix sp. AX1]MCI5182071.1 hypothetical protein [Candidatus Electrothrix gigas]
MLPEVLKIADYHLVFISLILAAAVTEVLSSLGTYIRNHRYIEFSYILAVWILLSLLATIQFWYAIANYYIDIPEKCSGIELYPPYFLDIISAIFYYLRVLKRSSQYYTKTVA